MKLGHQASDRAVHAVGAEDDSPFVHAAVGAPHCDTRVVYVQSRDALVLVNPSLSPGQPPTEEVYKLRAWDVYPLVTKTRATTGR